MSPKRREVPKGKTGEETTYKEGCVDVKVVSRAQSIKSRSCQTHNR